MKHIYPNHVCTSKGTLPLLTSFSRQLLLLLSALMLAVSVPTDTFSQTDKRGNFFQRRFKRKNKFQRKSSRKKEDFQRKPYDCAKIGKTKVKKLRISKRQLRKWEEEQLVKAQQAQRKTDQNQSHTTSKITSNATKDENLNQVSVSSSQAIIEQTQNNVREEKKNKPTSEVTAPINQKDSNTEDTNSNMLGWYETDKPQAPKIAPMQLNHDGQIEKAHLEDFETVAKYGRLGYVIHLKAHDQQTLETLKTKLIQAKVDVARIKTTLQASQARVVYINIGSE